MARKSDVWNRTELIEKDNRREREGREIDDGSFLLEDVCLGIESCL